MKLKIAHRFILCLITVCVATFPASSQQPQRRRVSQQRQARSNPAQSPAEVIARAYADGLTVDKFTSLWQHAPLYSFQVQLAVKSLSQN
jgi:hypothetical protein